jgi:hypothetical protein
MRYLEVGELRLVLCSGFRELDDHAVLVRLADFVPRYLRLSLLDHRPQPHSLQVQCPSGVLPTGYGFERDGMVRIGKEKDEERGEGIR